jgi:hypothetical protein
MAIATEHTTKGRRRLAWLRPIKLPPPVNPALVKDAEERADEFGSRLADAITRFAGSMTFVYLTSSGSPAGSGSASSPTRTGC